MEYRGRPRPSNLKPDRLAFIESHLGRSLAPDRPARAAPRYVPAWKPRRPHINLDSSDVANDIAGRSHRGTPCDTGANNVAGAGGDDEHKDATSAGERSYLDAPRDALPQDPTLRSSRWFLADELNTMRHVSRTKQMGYDDKDFQGKPIIAIINTWSDLLPCHSHFVERVEEVKRGIWQAGGFPAELPCMAVSETFMKPSSMLYRNFLAMQVRV